MYKKNIKIGLLMGILSSAENCFAVEDEESLFFAEMPTVLSATRMQQSQLETPVSVTVIDRRMIEASGFTEIPDLLRLVPGFQVARADARQYAATYHGKSSQYSARLQVLVDGRSLYHSMLSTVEWASTGVHIDDIERIEVIRGPNAPAYGANAFIAAVNIVTRSPLLDQGYEISSTVGSESLREFSAKTSGVYQGFNYRLRANYRSDDGFDEVNDERDLTSVFFRGGFSPTASDNVDLFLGVDYGDTGASATNQPLTLGSGRTIALDPARERETNNHYQHIRWQHIFSPESDLTIQFYHNYYKQEDATPLQASLSELFNVTPAQIQAALGQPDQTLVLAKLHGVSERYDLDIQHTIIAPDQYRIAWGGGLRRDSLDSYYHLGSDTPVKDYSARLFFNGEFDLSPSLTTNIGLMVENGDIVDTQYSPRLALNWNISDQQVIRIAATRAYRNPSLLEANWDYGLRFNDGSIADQLFLTETSLDAEKITSYELGFTGESVSKQWFWDVKLFREVLEGGINSADNEGYIDPLGVFLPVSRGARVEGNFQDSESVGIEGQLVYRPNPASFVALQYSYADVELFAQIDIDPFVQGYRKEPAPYHTASLLMATKLDGGYDLSAGFYHVGAMRWLGDGDAVDPYNRIDLRIAKTFSFGREKASIAWVIQNITDEYNEFTNDIEMPKQYTYLQFTWRR